MSSNLRDENVRGVGDVSIGSGVWTVGSFEVNGGGTWKTEALMASSSRS